MTPGVTALLTLAQHHRTLALDIAPPYTGARCDQYPGLPRHEFHAAFAVIVERWAEKLAMGVWPVTAQREGR